MEEKLALLGGKPVFEGSLPPANTYDQNEREAVLRVMDSGVLSDFVGRAGDYFLGGREVKALEESFIQKFGSAYAVSFNSATTALEAAVTALELEPGSEVIVPPFTMTATVTSIILHNLVPVFVDIDEHNFCMDPDLLRAAISPKTKAVMAVNLFGGPADYQKILSIAREHNLKVIEDNAQAPGALYHGAYTGTMGDMGIFSFNVHKTVQCGEGGVLVTNNEDYAFRARLKRNHGENVVDDLNMHDIPVVGSNYRMTELHAAIAREQLKKMDALNQHRIDLVHYLTQALRQFPFIKAFEEMSDSKHVYYVYPFLYDASMIGISRDLFIQAMKAEGFALSGGYTKPVYLLNFFQDNSTYRYWSYLKKDSYVKGLCPVAERCFYETLVFTAMCRYPVKKEHIDLFIEALRKVFSQRETLKDWHL